VFFSWKCNSFPTISGHDSSFRSSPLVQSAVLALAVRVLKFESFPMTSRVTPPSIAFKKIPSFLHRARSYYHPLLVELKCPPLFLLGIF